VKMPEPHGKIFPIIFRRLIGGNWVSSWDPNVIYAVPVKKPLRGNVSSGNGMWRSEDAGKTWKAYWDLRFTTYN